MTEICKICGFTTNHIGGCGGLTMHLNKSHFMSYEDYYRKFFMSDKEGFCLQCGQTTRFDSNTNRYLLYCSKYCQSKDIATKAWSNRSAALISNLEKLRSHKKTAKERLALSQLMKARFQDPEFMRRHKERSRKTVLRFNTAPEFHDMRSLRAITALENRGKRIIPYNGIKMRSSWEVRFAELCDQHQIKWQYEPHWFFYTDESGIKRRYLPDFFIPSLDTFVEIKPLYFQPGMGDVIRQMKDNYNVNVIMLDKSKFDWFFDEVH